MIRNQYSEVSLSIRSYDADMMGARMILKQSKIFQLADLQSFRVIKSIFNYFNHHWKGICVFPCCSFEICDCFSSENVNQFLEKSFSQIFGTSWLDRRAKVGDCVIFATL